MMEEAQRKAEAEMREKIEAEQAAKQRELEEREKQLMDLQKKADR